MLHGCPCWTAHPRKAYVSRAATVFNELKKPYAWSLIHKLWQAHPSWIWKIVGYTYTCFCNFMHVYNQNLRCFRETLEIISRSMLVIRTCLSFRTLQIILNIGMWNVPSPQIARLILYLMVHLVMQKLSLAMLQTLSACVWLGMYSFHILPFWQGDHDFGMDAKSYFHVNESTRSKHH